MEKSVSEENSKLKNRRDRVLRQRYRSAIVRDSLGSRSAFRRFYQSGGRDYEQYRLWLESQPRSPLSNTKSEEIEPNVNCCHSSVEQPRYMSQLVPIASINYSPSLVDWSVDDVAQFIREHFPETNLSQKFSEQKIDGRTLPLLNEDHLRRVFKMKLGPTLHLLSLINDLKCRY